MKDALPVVNKKKKINKKKFMELAKRVRGYLEDEERYLDKKRLYENSASG